MPKNDEGIENESPRSDIATYSDEASATSNQVPQEIESPYVNEPSTSRIRPLPRLPLPGTSVMNQDVAASHDVNDAMVTQQIHVEKEATSTELESIVEGPVLAELRGIRAQVARLQMQMEEMVVHNAIETESPPMYNQVV